jgi:hypothetical protein
MAGKTMEQATLECEKDALTPFSGRSAYRAGSSVFGCYTRHGIFAIKPPPLRRWPTIQAYPRPGRCGFSPDMRNYRPFRRLRIVASIAPQMHPIKSGSRTP